MRRALAVLLYAIAFLGYALTALGQGSQGGYLPIQMVTAAPSGACTQGAAAELVASSGVIYTCQGGVWAIAGGGGGGGPYLPLAGGTMTGATGGVPIAGGINATQYLLNGISVLTAGTANQIDVDSNGIASLDQKVIYKLPNLLNVTAFGAVCDWNGTTGTDNTAAIQSAITNAQTVPSAIHVISFPNGMCGVNGTLQINKGNIVFQGNGSGRITVGTLGNGSLQSSGIVQMSSSAIPLIQLGHNQQAAITSISRASNVVTANFAAMPNGTITNGFLVDIAGVTDSSFNGTFTLTSSSSTSATWNQTAADGSSSGGTITEDYSAGDYHGLAPNFQIYGMTLINGNPTTPLLTGCTFGVNTNYTPGSVAIEDWRGGTIYGWDLAIDNFDYSFFGVASDLDQFYFLWPTANHSGFWVGPRSDQMKIIGGVSSCNDTTFAIDSAWQFSLEHFTMSDDGSTTTYPISASANYPATGTARSTQHVLLDDLWLESLNFSGTAAGWISLNGNTTNGGVVDHTFISRTYFNGSGVFKSFVNMGAQTFDVNITNPTRQGSGSIGFTNGFIDYSGIVNTTASYLDPGIYNTIGAPILENANLLSTSVAPTNPSGNNWTYTFSYPLVGACNNNWVASGASFVIAGYTSGATGNNGTFTFAGGAIVSSTCTTVTIVNASGTVTNTGTPTITGGTLTNYQPLTTNQTLSEMFEGTNAGSQYIGMGNAGNGMTVGYNSSGGKSTLGSSTASTSWALAYQPSSPSGSFGTVSATGDTSGNVGIGSSNTPSSDQWYAKPTGIVTVGATKFTTSGCSVSSTTGDGTAGKMTLGANTCSVVVTLNGATGMTANNGWTCWHNDETTAAANALLYESANNGTTATFSVPSTAGTTDVIDFGCIPY